MDRNEQTEAVFKSSRTDVDPVSGNEVPVGALPEEVRDDVPAMLSEGEYVVPADVLRYYGVKFFEDLRNEAKTGLTELDAGGRIGGEPVQEEGDDLPFSDEELMSIDDGEEETPGFADGGLNITKSEAPSYVNTSDMSALGFDVGTSASEDGVEFRTYVNSNGLEITIPFFNGESLGAIPAGYSIKGSTSSEDTDKTEGVKVEREGRDTSEENTAGKSPSTGSSVDGESMYDGMTAAELSDISSKLSTTGTISKVASLVSPVLGLAGSLVNKPQNQALARAAQTGYNTATDPEEKAAFEKVFNQVTTGGKEKGSGILGGGGIMGGGGTLRDSNKDGSISFGDTALGDALGFDGKIGIQGDSIADSIQGSRRTGGTGKKSAELGNTTKDTTSTSTSGDKDDDEES